MTLSRTRITAQRRGWLVLVVALVAQVVVLPAAWGQSTLANVDGLEFEDGLLEEPWSDPIARFDLEGEPLAPIPNFDFDELSVSDVLAQGVGSQRVAGDVDVSVESQRHLLALQAVATAELARSTVDQNISTADGTITGIAEGIASARLSIDNTRDSIAEAEDQVAELDAADDQESEEQARLDAEMDNRRLAIVEVAMQAFTGEDLELETMLLNPESTDVLERRIVVDQVREIHRDEIDGFEALWDQSQGRRDALAAERAPVAASILGWQQDIVAFRGRVAELADERIVLRSEVVVLRDRGEELDVIIEDTLAFAETTAAKYQVAFHQRLDAFVTGTDVPLVALNAYVRAAAALASEQSGCGIHWSQLAGIGRIESYHGYFGNSTLDVNGNTTTDILGLPLDGRVLGGVVTNDLPDATGRTQETAGVQRLALILDSDNGALDGDRVYDRAVGPMQFIPTTWAIYGADGNGDGVEDPQNIYDAALAAARYLCAAPGSMLTSTGEQRAYFAYNHDLTYSANVTRAGRGYHNQLDVSPESGSFASFARIPIPVNQPAVEVLGTTEEAEEVLDQETLSELGPEAAAELAEAVEATESTESAPSTEGVEDAQNAGDSDQAIAEEAPVEVAVESAVEAVVEESVAEAPVEEAAVEPVPEDG